MLIVCAGRDRREPPAIRAGPPSRPQEFLEMWPVRADPIAVWPPTLALEEFNLPRIVEAL